MTERDQLGRDKKRWTVQFMADAGMRGTKTRRHRRHGAAGMVLDPLAEIGGGVFMTVIVGRGQFMMNFQRRGKRREHHQRHRHRHGDE